jgi:hypothetical protein
MRKSVSIREIPPNICYEFVISYNTEFENLEEYIVYYPHWDGINTFWRVPGIDNMILEAKTGGKR